MVRSVWAHMQYCDQSIDISCIKEFPLLGIVLYIVSGFLNCLVLNHIVSNHYFCEIIHTIFRIRF
jgi:hypothetical protein